MDSYTNRLLGKILGEMFRIQRASDIPCAASDAQVYGLLNGFEDSISEVLEGIGFISSEKVQIVMDILEPIWADSNKLSKFKGFYDIEPDLNNHDVSRIEAIQILKYLKANHQFEEIISKMDTSNSPMECRRFEISDWER